MRNLKVLHIASFSGNIGDLLSHKGFYPWFLRNLSNDIAWTKFEIRDVFRGLASFEKDIVPLIEKHDLTVIGGGNYLETWPSNSRTGTSIDLDVEFLKNSSKPIFFNGLGVDVSLGISEQAAKNLPSFFKTILSSSNYLLSVRNDGAASALSRFTSEANWFTIPDHGFFGFEKSLEPKPQAPREKIVINIAEDMPELRFGNSGGIESFIAGFATQLLEIMDTHPRYHIQFVPHVFSDVKLACKIIERLPDKHVREVISIAELDTGANKGLGAFVHYDDAALILANRFHSNIYPLSQGIKTIGLVNHPQLSNLYSELGSRGVNRESIDLRNDLTSLASRVKSLIRSSIDGEGEKLELMNSMEEMRSNFEPTLRRWLVENLGISVE